MLAWCEATDPIEKCVNHSIDEYVRGDAHTNTVEGYFSILKARHLWRLSSCEPSPFEALSL
jgi:hypothetical protein